MLSAVSPPPLIVDLIANVHVFTLSLSIFSTRFIKYIFRIRGFITGGGKIHAENRNDTIVIGNCFGFTREKWGEIWHESAQSCCSRARQVLINGRSWPRVLQKPQCISPTPTAGPWLITPEVCNFMRMYATMVAYKPFGDYTRRCA